MENQTPPYVTSMLGTFQDSSYSSTQKVNFTDFQNDCCFHSMGRQLIHLANCATVLCGDSTEVEHEKALGPRFTPEQYDHMMPSCLETSIIRDTEMLNRA